MLPVYLTVVEDGCVLAIRVIPGARKTTLVGTHDGALKLKVAAPPVDGSANRRLLTFLAKTVLCCPRSAITIISGERGRLKRLHLTLPPERVSAAIARCL